MWSFLTKTVDDTWRLVVVAGQGFARNTQACINRCCGGGKFRRAGNCCNPADFFWISERAACVDGTTVARGTVLAYGDRCYSVSLEPPKTRAQIIALGEEASINPALVGFPCAPPATPCGLNADGNGLCPSCPCCAVSDNPTCPSFAPTCCECGSDFELIVVSRFNMNIYERRWGEWQIATAGSPPFPCGINCWFSLSGWFQTRHVERSETMIYRFKCYQQLGGDWVRTCTAHNYAALDQIFVYRPSQVSNPDGSTICPPADGYIPPFDREDRLEDCRGNDCPPSETGRTQCGRAGIELRCGADGRIYPLSTVYGADRPVQPSQEWIDAFNSTCTGEREETTPGPAVICNLNQIPGAETQRLEWNRRFSCDSSFVFESARIDGGLRRGTATSSVQVTRHLITPCAENKCPPGSVPVRFNAAPPFPDNPFPVTDPSARELMERELGL